MRRFKLFAAALIAVAAVVVSASSAASAAQLPLQLSDNFNGTNVTPGVWGYVDGAGGDQNAGTTLGVHNGALQLTASSAAGSGFHTGLTTGCQAVGDFDATIRFTLSTWPAGDNVSLALNSNLGNTWVDSAIGGDVFGLFVFPSGGGGTLGSVRGGDLRLSRRGDLISSYVRSGHAGNWVQIGESIGPTDPTWIDVAMWNVSDFGGQPVSVQVESFQLDAAGLSC